MNFKYCLWGPLVFSVHLDKKDLIKVKKLCKKDKTKDARSILAASISDEFLIDKNKYVKILEPYLNKYAETYQWWYKRNISQIQIESSWVNYMKNGEYNPPHCHSNCQLSSVLYTQVPKILKKEHSKYVGTIKDGGPGSISFMHGESKRFSLNNYTFFPEEGCLFIFPHDLFHYVTPFKSKCERVSVAANFTIK